MTIVVTLPERYPHDHFKLTVKRELEPGELTPQDIESLHQVLRRTRRIAARLANLDEQQ